MFFSLTGQINYDSREVIDISKRVNFIKNLLNNEDFYFSYQLKHGDKPETIAFDFYGDASHHWIIILANEIYDPFYDWYMEDREVVEYAKLKYGDPEYFTGIKHYTDSDGIIYKEPLGNRTPITFVEYEKQLNDARQVIKVVYPEFLDQILQEYRLLIQ